LSTQHRAVATCVFVCAVFPILPAEWMCLGVAEQAQNSEFEYWTGQNASLPLRFVFATAGINSSVSML